MYEIDITYPDITNVKLHTDIFKGLPAEGKITFSSDKLTSDFVEMIPETWLKIGIKDTEPEISKNYIVAKYKVISTEVAIRIYSKIAPPPIYKDFSPYISSIWVDDKKVEVTKDIFLFISSLKNNK